MLFGTAGEATRPALLYTTYTDVRAMADVVATGDDTILKACVVTASALVDGHCGRQFGPTLETRNVPITEALRLDLNGADLLALTGLVNGDGVTLNVANVIAMPTQFYPRKWLETVYSGYPFVASILPYAAVTGWWGYHEQPGNMWRSAGALAAALNNSATTFTLAGVAGQEVLQIDDEIMVVVSAATTVTPLPVVTTATVIRACNGTVAASHLISAPIYRFYPMDLIGRAALTLAYWLYRRLKDGPWDRVALPELGAVVTPSEIPADVRGMLKRFRKAGVA